MAGNSGQKFIARNRAPRVQIEYDVELYGAEKKVQLPFVMGVMSDLSGKSTVKPPEIEDRRFLEIDVDNFDDRMRGIAPRVAFSVPNTLTGEGNLEVDLTFERMDDFSPGAIAARIEHLRPLLEARTELSNLMAYMDGKAGAEALLEKVLANPDLLRAVSSMSRTDLSEREQADVLAELKAAAPAPEAPEDATEAALASLASAPAPQAAEEDTSAAALASLAAAQVPEAVEKDDAGAALASLAAVEVPDEVDENAADQALSSLAAAELPEAVEKDDAGAALASLAAVEVPDEVDENAEDQALSSLAAAQVPEAVEKDDAGAALASLAAVEVPREDGVDGTKEVLSSLAAVEIADEPEGDAQEAGLTSLAAAEVEDVREDNAANEALSSLAAVEVPDAAEDEDVDAALMSLAAVEVEDVPEGNAAEAALTSLAEVEVEEVVEDDGAEAALTSLAAAETEEAPEDNAAKAALTSLADVQVSQPVDDTEAEAEDALASLAAVETPDAATEDAARAALDSLPKAANVEDTGATAAEEALSSLAATEVPIEAEEDAAEAALTSLSQAQVEVAAQTSDADAAEAALSSLPVSDAPEEVSESLADEALSSLAAAETPPVEAGEDTATQALSSLAAADVPDATTDDGTEAALAGLAAAEVPAAPATDVAADALSSLADLDLPQEEVADGADEALASLAAAEPEEQSGEDGVETALTSLADVEIPQEGADPAQSALSSLPEAVAPTEADDGAVADAVLSSLPDAPEVPADDTGGQETVLSNLSPDDAAARQADGNLGAADGETPKTETPDARFDSVEPVEDVADIPAQETEQRAGVGDTSDSPQDGLSGDPDAVASVQAGADPQEDVLEGTDELANSQTASLGEDDAGLDDLLDLGDLGDTVDAVTADGAAPKEPGGTGGELDELLGLGDLGDTADAVTADGAAPEEPSGAGDDLDDLLGLGELGDTADEVTADAAAHEVPSGTGEVLDDLLDLGDLGDSADTVTADATALEEPTDAGNDLDDLLGLGELGDTADAVTAETVAPEEPGGTGDDLDDLLGLGDLGDTVDAVTAETVAPEESGGAGDDLDDLLGDLGDVTSESAEEQPVDPLDDLLGDAGLEGADTSPDPLDDLLGDLEAVAPEAPEAESAPSPEGAATAQTDIDAADPLDDLLDPTSPEDEAQADGPDELLTAETDQNDSNDPADGAGAVDPLDDLLGDLSGATADSGPDPLDDLLGDLGDNDDDGALDELLAENPTPTDAEPATQDSAPAADKGGSQMTPEPEFAFGLMAAARPDAQALQRKRFRIALMGDFSGRAARGLMETGDALAARKAVLLDPDTVEDVIESFATTLVLPIGKDGTGVEVKLGELDDLHPDELFENLPLFAELKGLRGQLSSGATAGHAQTQLRSWAEAHGQHAAPPKRVSGGNAVPADLKLSDFQQLIGDTGGALTQASPVEDLIARVVGPHIRAVPDADVAAMQGAVDESISAAMRLILHHPDYQSIEAQWRSLDLIARSVESDDSLEVMLYDVSAEEIAADLAAAEDLSAAGLTRLLTEEPLDEELGRGGYSALIGLYTFEETPPHAALLGRIARVAAHVDAPFFAAMTPGFMGVDKQDRHPLVAQAWDDLRAMPEARHLGLAAPRFMLRRPYGAKSDPIYEFDFEEFTEAEGLSGMLWANPVVLVAILLARSFKMNGKSMNLGSVMSLGDVPYHVVNDRHGDQVALPCTERNITESKLEKVMARGFMPVVSMKGRDEIRLASFQSMGGGEILGPWSGEMPPPPSTPKAASPATPDAGEDDLDALLAGFDTDQSADSASDGDIDADLAALLDDL